MYGSLGPNWFWRLIGVLALVGLVSFFIWAIKGIIWLINHVKIITITVCLLLFGASLNAQKTTVTVHPCRTDTIKGILFRGENYNGNGWVELGYYIAKCGGIQIGGGRYFDNGIEGNTRIWIPGRFLRNDQVDNKGKYIYKEFQWQYNVGYFTDRNFKKIDISCVYGLLVDEKKAF